MPPVPVFWHTPYGNVFKKIVRVMVVQKKVTAAVINRVNSFEPHVLTEVLSGIVSAGNVPDLVVLPSLVGHGILSPGAAEQRLHELGALARSFNVYLSVHGWLEDDHKLRSRGWLVNPGGKLCLFQDQTHDRSGRLAVGSDLRVTETSIGKVGFLLGDDVFVPEVGRILRLKGANLFIAYSFLPVPPNPWRQWAGVWQQVQQNQVFAVESGFKGEAGGRKFSGESIIHGPCELTAGETGFLIRDKLTEPHVVAELDYVKLQQVIAGYPLHRYYNKELYQTALRQCYLR